MIAYLNLIIYYRESKLKVNSVKLTLKLIKKLMSASYKYDDKKPDLLH